jgi:hypothetical protein
MAHCAHSIVSDCDYAQGSTTPLRFTPRQHYSAALPIPLTIEKDIYSASHLCQWSPHLRRQPPYTMNTTADPQSTVSASKTGKNDDNVIFGASQQEVERLDIQHKTIYAAMPKLVQAPIDLSKGGQRILDQATGSGACQSAQRK